MNILSRHRIGAETDLTAGTRRKVLIVEDGRVFREMLQRILAMKGYEVELAGDGAEGWAKYQSFWPDLVILDRNLPRLSGSEVLRRIRGVDRETRVIVLTGFWDRRGEAKYRELRVDAFLSKGFSMDDLMNAVSLSIGAPATG